MNKMDDLNNSSALAALNFIKNYNHLMFPNEIPQPRFVGLGPMRQGVYAANLDPIYVDARAILGYQPLAQPPFYLPPSLDCDKVSVGERVSAATTATSEAEALRRRNRGEKRPTPDEQKDDKYFERRKRNNQAAKKSRDARKIREDQIALRACVLEHENAALRAQLAASRSEAASLRRLLVRRSDAPANICLSEIITSTTIDTED